MKLIIIAFAAVWLMSGCATNAADEDSNGAGYPDPRSGLCYDGTAPPCPPPKD